MEHAARGQMRVALHSLGAIRDRWGRGAVHVERWTAPTGKERLLVRMDPPTAARYARVAQLAVPRASPGPRSYGSARRPDRAPRFLTERQAWRAALARAAVPGDVAEIGDVAACYPSIGERALRDAARAGAGDVEPLLHLLRDVWALGVHGIPIGPSASSYLADAVLSVADVAAGRAGLAPVRWVDDVVFVGSRRTVERASRAWRSTLRELGLVEHDGKRRTTTDVGDVLRTVHATASTVRGAPHGIIRL
jgi:hypothetical protein